MMSIQKSFSLVFSCYMTSFLALYNDAFGDLWNSLESFYSYRSLTGWTNTILRWSQTLSLALNLLAKYSCLVWLPGTLFFGCHGDGSVCGVSRGGLFTKLIKMQEIVMGPICLPLSHQRSAHSQYSFCLSLFLWLSLSLSLETLIDQGKHSGSSLSFYSSIPLSSFSFVSLLRANRSSAAPLSPVYLC